MFVSVSINNQILLITEFLDSDEKDLRFLGENVYLCFQIASLRIRIRFSHY